jgi:hypothetical protein
MALEHSVAEERALDPTASRLTVEAFVARHMDLTLDPDVFIRLLHVDPVFREPFTFLRTQKINERCAAARHHRVA